MKINMNVRNSRFLVFHTNFTDASISDFHNCVKVLSPQNAQYFHLSAQLNIVMLLF